MATTRAAMLGALVATVSAAYVGGPRVWAQADPPARPQARRRGPAPPALLVTSAMLARGRDVYQADCAPCHGEGGRGDGTLTASLPWKPQDQTAAAFMDGLSDMDIASVVQHGGFKMPSVPNVRGDDLVALVAFVRSLSHDTVRVVELQAIAQGEVKGYVPVTREMLADPPPGDWLMMGRTYDEWSFSPLDQITRDNVGRLQLAWSRAMNAGGQYTTPLVHGGVIYIENPDAVVQALDGRTGDLIWELRYQPSAPAAASGAAPEERRSRDGRQGGGQRNSRSLAMYGHRLFLVTQNAHLLAIDARTGTLEWDTTEVPGVRGIGHMGGPLVADGKVIVGHAAAATAGPTGGFIAAYDADTGKEVWRRYMIPRPGEPGDESWVGLPYEQRRHVASWGVGSYDPQSNLIFWGTSVPAPSLELLRGTPKGEALYSNSTLALDARTGTLVWYYQHLPRDNWDLDHVFEHYLVDTEVAPDPAAVRWINPKLVRGERRKVVTGIPGKTGVIYTLDRQTGEFLWARETIHQNVIADIDGNGKVSINESLIARPFEEKFVCPSLGGGKNWPSGAYSPLTHLMYQPLQNMCMLLTGSTDKPTPEDGYATSWIIVEDPAVKGDPYPVGRVDAVSIDTGRTAWLHQQRAGTLGSLMATAGGLVFGGDVNRRFKAFDDTTGVVRWETMLNGPVSGHPVSYEIDHQQYIAVPAGGNTASPERRALSLHPEIKVPAGINGLFVFRLPDNSQPRRSIDIKMFGLLSICAAIAGAMGYAVGGRSSRHAADTR